ncbi:hypothetical protein RFI_26719, partial [Reticulomyxa filosa]
MSERLEDSRLEKNFFCEIKMANERKEENKDVDGLSDDMEMIQGRGGHGPGIMSSKIEFRDIIQKFRGIEEDWKQKRVHPAVATTTAPGTEVPTTIIPIVNKGPLPPAPPRDKLPKKREKSGAIKVSAVEAGYVAEKNQMTETIQTLSKEVSNLKSQNEELCIKLEQMKQVLKQSKNYCQSLNNQVQELASEMQFQSELHQQ